MTTHHTDLNVTVASETLRAIFSTADGSLISLVTLDAGWSIIDDAALGLGFCLLLPLDGKRNNVADSRAQSAPAWEVGPDLSWVTAEWSSLVSEHGGVHDVGVRMRVAAEGPRLVFSLEIDNRSTQVVEDVRFPRLGDVLQCAVDQPLYSVMAGYADARRVQLRPQFTDSVPYFGVDRPTYLNGPMRQSAVSPYTPFVLVEDGERGLYVGVDERTTEIVGWIAELRPGYSDSMHLRVPMSDLGAPEPTCVRLEAVHVPYAYPGTTTRLPDVALVAFDGSWQAGAEIYRSRRSTWSTPAVAPAWAAGPEAWMQLQVNSPEDELRLPFERLPEVARSCVSHGVRTIQLVGWNEGGQDRNNPNHTPDPRLGGAEALRAAIEECKCLGVRVVLFAKFTWADRTTDRYRTDLVRESIKDPYGDPYVFEGFMYNTVSQMLGISPRPLVPMCFASDRYREICDLDAAAIVDLGADGMLFDECLHHGPALVCFDTMHGHRPGHSAFSHDLALIEGFADYARTTNPDFLYAGEACYDGQFEVYPFSYHRSYEVDHLPLTRVLNPRAQLMTAITGFDERNLVGQALVRRYVLSYEPYHFKGRLEDFPATTEYGRSMDVLRTTWREWFWDGDYRDEGGASVRTSDGASHRPYAVYVPTRGGHPGVAVANHSDEPVVLTVVVEGWDEQLAAHFVDGRTWVPCDRKAGGARFELPGSSAAILLPQRVVGP